MKKITILTATLLIANLLFAQINKIDTSFYSQALGEEKMVDVYFPPGYDDNTDLYYPVIYYLHCGVGSQDELSFFYPTLNALINNGTVDPVIMVCADNSPDPFGGSMYMNSILWGDYETYMTEDLIAWIDSSFRTVPDKRHRALLGQSMGGTGAFRLGILHKDKYCALAAHAPGAINMTFYADEIMADAALEQQSGPPYFFDYYNAGLLTQLAFLYSGAFSPDSSTQQTYINPPIVNFIADDSCHLIDSIFYQYWMPNDIVNLIDSLNPEDSVGIFFSCGTNDWLHLYPAVEAFQDTLDLLGLPYEFYSHTGDHGIPYDVKVKALIFLDSLLAPLVVGIEDIQPIEKSTKLTISPNPSSNYITIFISDVSARFQISIFNLKGQELIQLESTEPTTTIDISALANGMYILKVMGEKKVLFGKLLKE